MIHRLLGGACLAGAILFAAGSGDAWAQEDERVQRIKELEDRIEDVEAKIWIDKVESYVDHTPTCAEHETKAKAYYDQAVALNEQYRGHATAEYQQQINDAKARNREEIGLYKRCFEETIANSGESHGGVSTFDQFQEFAFDVTKRLSGAPKDLESYLAQLKRELEALMAERTDFVGTLTSIFGQAEVSHMGRGFEPAQRGMRLYQSDIIRTGPRGRARIELAGCRPEDPCGPAVINIGSNTELDLKFFKVQFGARPQFEGVFDLIKGAIRVFFKNWGGTRSSFAVRTGTSLCGIRGTDIALQYDPTEDRAEYLLKEGTVEIQTAASGTQTLQAGHALKVERGTAAPVQPLTDSLWSSAMAAIGSEGAAAGGAGQPATTAAPATPPAAPGPRYGAMAYSRSTGVGAMTKKGTSEADAQKRVLEDCRNGSKAEDCRLLIWFENGCGAFAREKGAFGPYGAHWAKSQPEADAKAMAICAEYGGKHCEVIARFCTQ